eukprot:1159864-Pelagomonas_calceolata.AAC.16
MGPIAGRPVASWRMIVYGKQSFLTKCTVPQLYPLNTVQWLLHSTLLSTEPFPNGSWVWERHHA